MKAHRLVPFAVVAALFALSGCSESPNHAATVDGDAISTSDVNFLTRVQCGAYNEAKGQVQPESLRALRASMLNVLVATELGTQLTDNGPYDKATYKAQIEQLEPAAQRLPAKDRDRFRTLVGNYLRSQLQVQTLAQAKLIGAGIADPTQDQLLEAINAELTSYGKKADVKINPVYGPRAGVAGVTDPSLSVAVSDFAKDATSTNQETASAFLDGLPKNQRCG